jgi:hypothetical protein
MLKGECGQLSRDPLDFFFTSDKKSGNVNTQMNVVYNEETF